MTSRRLDSFARAAMLGLLAAAQPACGDDSHSELEGTGGAGVDSNDGDGGSNDGTASGGIGAASSSGGSATGGGATGGTASGAGGVTINPSGGVPGSAGEGGAGGAVIEGVLSSKIIPDLSREDFTALCDEAGGVVETHAHCGGLVTGPGFSYDSGTDVFTEHTCAGYNTCTGFSCVIDD